MNNKDIRQGKGFGFWVKKKVFLVRCFECGSENWAPAVAAGQCAWCGFDANKKGAVNEPIRCNSKTK